MKTWIIKNGDLDCLTSKSLLGRGFMVCFPPKLTQAHECNYSNKDLQWYKEGVLIKSNDGSGRCLFGEPGGGGPCGTLLKAECNANDPHFQWHQDGLLLKNGYNDCLLGNHPVPYVRMHPIGDCNAGSPHFQWTWTCAQDYPIDFLIKSTSLKQCAVPYAITFGANDPDRDPLTYVSFDDNGNNFVKQSGSFANTGEVIIAPTSNTIPGEYTIGAIVRNVCGKHVKGEIKINIIKNAPPQSKTVNVEVEQCTEKTVDFFKASDPEGETITYSNFNNGVHNWIQKSATFAKDGKIIVRASELIPAGKYTIEASASDTCNNAATLTASIEVVSKKQESSGCSIITDKFYAKKYLYVDCFNNLVLRDANDFLNNIVREKDGYFKINHDDNKLLITKKGNLFLIKDIFKESYLSIIDGDKGVRHLGYSHIPEKASYWKIEGAECDFLKNQLYKKIDKVKEQCNTKVSLDKILLKSTPFQASGDEVTLKLEHGNDSKFFKGTKFTVADSTKTFSGESIIYKNQNLNIGLTVNGIQNYVFTVVQKDYNKYLTDNQHSYHITYNFLEQDLNGGEISVVSFQGGAQAKCSAMANYLMTFSSNVNLEAGCKAVMRGEAKFSTILGIKVAEVESVGKLICSAYLESRADLSNQFDFEAKCEAALNANAGITVKEVCFSGKGNNGLKFSGYTSDEFFGPSLALNNEACIFYNGIIKYVVDVTYFYDDQPNCLMPYEMSGSGFSDFFWGGEL